MPISARWRLAFHFPAPFMGSAVAQTSIDTAGNGCHRQHRPGRLSGGRRKRPIGPQVDQSSTLAWFAADESCGCILHIGLARREQQPAG
jgi:hypothetical protein